MNMHVFEKYLEIKEDELAFLTRNYRHYIALTEAFIESLWDKHGIRFSIENSHKLLESYPLIMAFSAKLIEIKARLNLLRNEISNTINTGEICLSLSYIEEI